MLTWLCCCVFAALFCAGVQQPAVSSTSSSKAGSAAPVTDDAAYKLVAGINTMQAAKAPAAAAATKAPAAPAAAPAAAAVESAPLREVEDSQLEKLCQKLGLSKVGLFYYCCCAVGILHSITDHSLAWTPASWDRFRGVIASCCAEVGMCICRSRRSMLECRHGCAPRLLATAPACCSVPGTLVTVQQHCCLLSSCWHACLTFCATAHSGLCVSHRDWSCSAVVAAAAGSGALRPCCSCQQGWPRSSQQQWRTPATSGKPAACFPHQFRALHCALGLCALMRHSCIHRLCVSHGWRLPNQEVCAPPVLAVTCHLSAAVAHISCSCVCPADGLAEPGNSSRSSLHYHAAWDADGTINLAADSLPAHISCLCVRPADGSAEPGDSGCQDAG